MTSDHTLPTATPIGQVVIVGASLAGLRAAEALRAEGFTGKLIIIGDESVPPYDRPPLSKSVLSGWLPVEHTFLPQRADLDAEWLLGMPAVGLDGARQQVHLADGRWIGYDRLLIATGTRPRPWPDSQQAALTGVFTLRTQSDAARLREHLVARPRRVLVIGGGFTGSEVASVCRELGLAVTLTERSATPLAGALGQAAGTAAARLQRDHGVDLRCDTTVMALEGDADQKLRRAKLSDGDQLEVDVAVVALGSLRNIEWLQGAGLAADQRGIACDGACRVFDEYGIARDDIFAAGDVARWPHPLFDGAFLVVEHWSHAVEQAATAAHNVLAPPPARRAYHHLPAFWSTQFGVSIRSVGLPTFADSIVLTQGTFEEQRMVAAYGHQGRVVAAAAINAPRSLPAYQELIETRAPFPPELHAADSPSDRHPIPTGFPQHGQPTHDLDAALSGSGPSSPEPAPLPDEAPWLDPREPMGAPPLA
jgi:3-phenylpropionate/trans-cinnamate dioxygenase ferredoxin reductase component